MKMLSAFLFATSVLTLSACKEDSNEAATRLFEEAVPFWQHAQSVRGDELEDRRQRLAALRVVHSNIEKIMTDYPESDIARLFAGSGQAQALPVGAIAREIQDLDRMVSCAEDVVACLVDQAVLEFRRIQDAPADRLMRARNFAGQLVRAGRPDLALELLAEARRLQQVVAAGIGLPATLADVRSHEAEILILAETGRIDEAREAIAALDEAVQGITASTVTSLKDRLEADLGVARLLRQIGDERTARERTAAVASQVASLGLTEKINILPLLTYLFHSLEMDADMERAGALASQLLQLYRETDFQQDSGADFRFGHLATVLIYAGRIEEGISVREITGGMSSHVAATHILDSLIATEQLDDAVEFLRTTQVGRIHLRAMERLLRTLIAQGRTEEARSLFPRVQIAFANETNSSSGSDRILMQGLARDLGYTQIADDYLQQVRERIGRGIEAQRTPFWGYDVVSIYLDLGRTDEAVAFTNELEVFGARHRLSTAFVATALSHPFNALLAIGEQDRAFAIAERLSDPVQRFELYRTAIDAMIRRRQREAPQAE